MKWCTVEEAWAALRQAGQLSARHTGHEDPWRALAAALVHRALKDAAGSNGCRTEAIEWLRCDQARELLNALDMAPAGLDEWLQRLEGERWASGR